MKIFYKKYQILGSILVLFLSALTFSEKIIQYLKTLYHYVLLNIPYKLYLMLSSSLIILILCYSCYIYLKYSKLKKDSHLKNETEKSLNDKIGEINKLQIELNEIRPTLEELQKEKEHRENKQNEYIRHKKENDDILNSMNFPETGA